MRVAVCDDSSLERTAVVSMIREYLASREIDARISEYADGETLLAGFIPGSFAIVFLDIYMEGMTGIDAARMLKVRDPACVIVFATTSLEHGPQAFDVEAFHYIVKPVDKAKLFSVLDRWYDRFCDEKNLTLKCGRKTVEIPLRDILYIDVLGRNCTVHTAGGSVQTAMSLAAIEESLPRDQFCRPIRYCLVAMRHVRSVQDDGIVMDDGETLPMSRLEKEKLRQSLAGYRLRALRGR